jgi:hypothetical protein
MVVYVVVAILLVTLAGLSMSVRIVKQYEREPLAGRLGVPRRRTNGP